MAVQTVQMPRQTPRPVGAEEMVARRVIWERRTRGWSNAELARRMAEAGCPINQSAIQKIEHGNPRRTISLDEALAFAKVFGVSLDELKGIPDEVVSADLAAYLDELGEIEAQLERLRGVILKLLERTAHTAEEAGPLLEYMESDPPWTPVLELEDGLTRLADLIIKVRDEVAKLRFTQASQ